MILRLGIAVLASALVLGCASETPPAQQWTRKDATPEDVKRDLYWCTGQVVAPPQALETPALGRKRVTDKVNDECMEQRGYTKVAPPKS